MRDELKKRLIRIAKELGDDRKPPKEKRVAASDLDSMNKLRKDVRRQKLIKRLQAIRNNAGKWKKTVGDNGERLLVYSTGQARFDIDTREMEVFTGTEWVPIPEESQMKGDLAINDLKKVIRMLGENVTDPTMLKQLKQLTGSAPIEKEEDNEIKGCEKKYKEAKEYVPTEDYMEDYIEENYADYGEELLCADCQDCKHIDGNTCMMTEMDIKYEVCPQYKKQNPWKGGMPRVNRKKRPKLKPKPEPEEALVAECINNKGYEDQFDVGVTYCFTVTAAELDMFTVTNKFGNEVSVFKDRFKIVREE